MNRIFVALVVWIAVGSSASGQLFDFESQPHATLPTVVSTIDGLTLTVESTVEGGFIYVLPAPPGFPWGVRHLLGLATENVHNDGFAPLRFEFSTPIDSFTVMAGDGGGDDDGFARIRAFDLADSEIDSHSLPHPANFSDPITLTVNAPGIKYVIADTFGGPSNFHSLGWDNVVVNGVPEPTSIGTAMAAMAIYALFVGRARKRQEAAS
jgi:hypothetical protein